MGRWGIRRFDFMVKWILFRILSDAESCALITISSSSVFYAADNFNLVLSPGLSVVLCCSRKTHFTKAWNQAFKSVAILAQAICVQSFAFEKTRAQSGGDLVK